MKRAWKILLYIAIISIIIILGLSLYLSSLNKSILPEGIVLYYGYSCPHCKIVEDFIENNSIDSKISITQKEVFINKENQKEYNLVADSCNIVKESRGVPLLFMNNTCYEGDVKIIALIKQLAEIN